MKLRKKQQEVLEGGGGDLRRRIGRQRDHSEFSVFLCGSCFVLAATWLVVESLRCANDFVEQLCDVRMQL
jgi:hypothetical protein